MDLYYRKAFNFTEHVILTISIIEFTKLLASINYFNHCCTKVSRGSSKGSCKSKYKSPNWNECFGTLVCNLFNRPMLRSTILVLGCRKIPRFGFLNRGHFTLKPTQPRKGFLDCITHVCIFTDIATVMHAINICLRYCVMIRYLNQCTQVMIRDHNYGNRRVIKHICHLGNMEYLCLKVSRRYLQPHQMSSILTILPH